MSMSFSANLNFFMKTKKTSIDNTNKNISVLTEVMRNVFRLRRNMQRVGMSYLE